MSDLPEGGQTADEPETPAEGALVTEKIELTQHWLGMEPYTLIRLVPSDDDPDEPTVQVEVGGGAQEEPMALLVFAITGTVAEGNKVAEMLRNLADDPALDRTTLEAVVDQFNPSWRPFVFRTPEV